MSPRSRSVLALAAALAATRAGAANDPTTVALAPVQQVEVQGHYLNGVGTSDAASEGVVGARLIAERPVQRPAEILEFVPGLVVTQHSGDGKANQYFLRGFNLDHGTDFATFVDGVPVNMPSHAHGQGYSDLNWLLPELVQRIDYRKGPYFAEEGDFASAGSARLKLMDSLPAPLAQATAGANGFARTLLAGSTDAGGGHTVLGALEAAHNDGPWTSPEKFHRVDGVVRASGGAGEDRWSLTAMGYAASWDATDQIPLRAVADGRLGRFDAVDASDGGRTSRASLSFAGAHRIPGDGPLSGEWRANAWALASRLDLWSDFTYRLDHPDTGDQFEQAESRRAMGASLWHRMDGTLLGTPTTTLAGVQLRHDRLSPVGLYDTVARVRTDTVQESRVRETSAAAWVENSTSWSDVARTVVGARVDRVAVDVDASIAGNSGARAATLASPKASLVLGPWARTELFVNAGEGFHSNDARGATESVAPREGTPASAVPLLVRTRGAELGLRTQAVPGLQLSAAWWTLGLDSELVFSGDAGDTEASRGSRRHGVELNAHWVASSHWLVDADFAASQARYTSAAPEGSSVPGAIATVATFGATLQDWGPWSGQFQFRYFGPRALVEDASVRSKATSLASLRVGYALSARTTLTLDVFNLFDRRASDIDYDYASRLGGEPAAGVEDVHFHPVEPRALRVTVAHRF